VCQVRFIASGVIRRSADALRRLAMVGAIVATASCSPSVVSAPSVQSYGPSFCGLTFGLDVRQQIPDCLHSHIQTCQSLGEDASDDPWIIFFDDLCGFVGNRDFHLEHHCALGVAEQEDNRLVEILLGFDTWQFSQVSNDFQRECGPPTVSTDQTPAATGAPAPMSPASTVRKATPAEILQRAALIPASLWAAAGNLELAWAAEERLRTGGFRSRAEDSSSVVQLWKCRGLYVRIDERGAGVWWGPGIEGQPPLGFVHITTPEHANADQDGLWTRLEGR
jgi:hypothetical protein